MLRIRDGRVIDPASGHDGVADVWVDEGHVVAIGRAPRGAGKAREIAAKGKVVCPGFADPGSHLREPGYERKATIASETRAAAAGGFTTLCCTPDTSPVLDNPSVLEHILHEANEAAMARVVCLGALTVGLNGEVLSEMHALKAAGCVGVTNLERAIKDTAVLKHALAYAASAELTVFLHAEDYWLARQGNMHEGPVSTRLGVPAIPASAEVIDVHRDLTLLAEAGARAHFCRLSAGDSIKPIVDARRRGLPVTADVALSNLCFTADDVGSFDANFHLRPPLRDARDRAALRKGVKSGAIDAIGAYHEPHDADAKAAPFGLTEPGVSSYETFLPALLALVEAGAFDLPAALTAASLAPHRVLGQAGGTLAVGAPADLCVFDPALRWVPTAASLLSAGKNSPYLGQPLTGRVTLTLVGGRIVHALTGPRA
jgi:dihydroorotase